MTLEKTSKTTDKLLGMARELNQWDGSQDWADTFSLEDADDYLTGVAPSEILRSLFFGNIEDGVIYSDAQVRYNGCGNLEVISSYALANEAWGCRDDILEDYRNEFGVDKLNEALSEMDTDEE